MADKILTFNGKTISGPSGTGMVVLKEPVHEVTIGGKTYRTVLMPDGKEWLAENLDFAWDGLPVPTSDAREVETPQAMYYNYDESTYGWNGYKCGLLYNWYAVKYLEDNKSTLIPGWHVATNAEWDALATAVGGKSTAGTKLKAKDNSVTSGWPSGWNGTDDYGFSAIPAGVHLGGFCFIGTRAYFWTATENNSSDACGWYFAPDSWLRSTVRNKVNYCSIYLVRDAT